MSHAPIEEDALARRLVEDGIVSKEVLDAALRDRPEGQPLGVFLVVKGLLAPDRLEHLLFPADQPSSAARREDVLVADALIEGRVVAPDQVEEARRVQRDVPLPLGTLLVRMGSVSPSQLRRRAEGISEPIPGEPVAWSPEVVEALRDPKRRFGKYVLLEEVGRGGMGVVYRAYDAVLDRQVALKMLLSDAFMVSAATTAGSVTTETQVERFRREARAAGRLSHPGVVPIYEVGIQNGFHFFTMEFVEGPSLEKVLRGTRLSPRLAARLLQEAALAVHYSHQAGVIHRDIKPGNLLLSVGAEPVSTDATVATRFVPSTAVLTELSGRVRIVDFGLARNIHATGLTTRGDIMGTPTYMAPEQASGEVQRVGPRSDVYSLGAVLYHAVTGRPPFLGEGPMQVITQVLGNDPDPPRTRVPDLPFDVEVIILRAMAKEPERRYADAQALADDLGRFLRGEPIQARPISRIERASRWVSRHRALSASLLALAIALVGGTWFGVRTVLDRMALNRALVLESHGTALMSEALDAQRNPDPDWPALFRKFDQAMEAFDGALREYPTLATSLHGRGVCLAWVGRYDEALADLDRLVQESPDYLQGRLDRAMIRISLVYGQVDPVIGARSFAVQSKRSHTAFPMSREEQEALARAREDLRHVAKLEPDRVKTQGASIWLLVLEGKLDVALRESEEVLARDRNLHWARLLRARCLAGRGRTEEALDELDRYLHIRPHDGIGLTLRALVLFDLDRVQEAIAVLRRRFSPFLSADDSVRKVSEFLASHGYGDEAIEELRRGATDPLAAWRLAGMSMAHLVRKDPKAALQCADEALRIDPHHGWVRYQRAQALLALDRVEEAIPEFRAAHAVGAFPAVSLHYWIACAELALERYDRALAEVGPAIAEVDDWSNLFALRGTILWRKRDLAAAEADFARAIELDPFDGRVHGLRGGVLYDMGRLEEALAEYEEEIDALPKDVDARLNRGSCLEALSRFDDALAEHDRAVAMAPDEPQPSLYRANLLYRLGRNEEAEAECTRGLSRNADHPGLHFTRAKARYQASKLDEALVDLATFLSKEPGRKEAIRLRGECYYFLGRWVEARSDLESAVPPDDKDPTTWFMLGACAMKQGDRAAIEYFRKAEELYPEGPERERARGAREAAEKKLGG